MKTYTVEVYPNGDRFWYNEKDQLHREDGPAFEWTNGYKAWFINGKLHREDGPAVEYVDGHKVWYINGELHREDGPAVEYANGDKAWWINGNELTEEEFNNRNKVELTLDEIASKFGIQVDKLKIKK